MVKKCAKVLVILFLLTINIYTVKAEENLESPPGGVGYTIAETFPDPHMAQAVADKLNKTIYDIILQTDVDNAIDWMNGFTFKGITDITGISHFKNLYVLSFGGNELSELPNEIQTMSNVKNIQIDYNNFTEIPEIISNFNNLTYLGVAGNQITEIPAFVWDLTELTILYLDSNQISEISEDIARLTKLRNLDLSYNHLTNLPDVFQELENISYINVESQFVYLPSQEWNETAQITNMITYGNEVIVPSSISQGGEYSLLENKVSWQNLSNQSQTLSYSFSKTITSGSKDFLFSGTVSLPIEPIEEETLTTIDETMITPLDNKVYNGVAHEPLLTIEYNQELLELGLDYEVSYLQNINVGTASAVVKGIGGFKGEVTVNFEITKATPIVIDLPSSTELSIGSVLSESLLSDGRVIGEEVDGDLEGEFSWVESHLVYVDGTYKVRFTPVNGNYTSVEMMVGVTVINDLEEPSNPQNPEEVEEPSDTGELNESTDISDEPSLTENEKKVLPNTGMSSSKIQMSVLLTLSGFIMVRMYRKRKNK